MKTSDILIKAKALIRDEANWTTNVLARDKNNKPLLPENPTACKFCAIGALRKAEMIENNNYQKDAVYYLKEAAHKLYETRYVEEVNDSPYTIHKDILNVYDLAIKLAKEENK